MSISVRVCVWVGVDSADVCVCVLRAENAELCVCPRALGAENAENKKQKIFAGLKMRSSRMRMKACFDNCLTPASSALIHR